jgi:DnaJ-class molecular chaperone
MIVTTDKIADVCKTCGGKGHYENGEPCPNCFNTGIEMERDYLKCPFCNGKGILCINKRGEIHYPIHS